MNVPCLLPFTEDKEKQKGVNQTNPLNYTARYIVVFVIPGLQLSNSVPHE
jgi:hypothetical protein